MISRLIYYSQLLKGEKAAFCHEVNKASEAIIAEWKGLGVTDASVFVMDPFVCVYAEAENSAAVWDWPAAFRSYLEAWPAEPNRERRESLSAIHANGRCIPRWGTFGSSHLARPKAGREAGGIDHPSKARNDIELYLLSLSNAGGNTGIFQQDLYYRNIWTNSVLLSRASSSYQ